MINSGLQKQMKHETCPSKQYENLDWISKRNVTLTTATLFDV